MTTLDPHRLVATHEELYRVLRHAGRFALLDGVLHRDEEENLIVGWKDIRADDWWAPDHIPGRPIFPGALMIETGAQLCSFDYSLRTGDEERFIGFGGLDGTRFRGMVEPGVRMHFVARAGRLRRTMFTYELQGLVGRDIVFETQVMGVAL